ncbi:HNH endonuclease family protein [Cellulomonas xiejunii]|uniref:HNH endonuclease family protein n=1 Tax=Cellulomonas xiejunii TaxID=2968083 RepID=A0ABY5KP30_9CELL|nr:HNH endonuclease family protein [Cellulomonas xiejunii]MCC2321439.1 HNH endonuclease family protein [Cellulomonas xiejunii]UUI72014.1 HNH endonuclease family protein [Cellulomonas xiejunii]
MTGLLTPARSVGARRRSPRPHRRTRARWHWVLLVVVGLAAGLGGPVVLDARAAAQYPVTASDLAAGRAALDTLAIKGRAPRTGYERDEFGQPWADVDRNGCDTRNDILRRDLVDPVAKPATRECVVLRGTLADPYTGESIAFERGERSSEVQIDHVVALADAWQKGAQRWTDEKRRLFANDPANLLAVDGSANQSKGAGDAATWLPPNTGYRCAYALRQTAVKAAYGLWATQAEHDALTRAIDRCVVAG